jgi:hypothetical protein
VAHAALWGHKYLSGNLMSLPVLSVNHPVAVAPAKDELAVVLARLCHACSLHVVIITKHRGQWAVLKYEIGPILKRDGCEWVTRCMSEPGMCCAELVVLAACASASVGLRLLRRCQSLHLG